MVDTKLPMHIRYRRIPKAKCWAWGLKEAFVSVQTTCSGRTWVRSVRIFPSSTSLLAQKPLGALRRPSPVKRRGCSDLRGVLCGVFLTRFGPPADRWIVSFWSCFFSPSKARSPFAKSESLSRNQLHPKFR